MRLLAILTAFAALAATPSFAGTPQTVMLDVQNMTCPVCPITVKKALEKVPCVAEAKIDFSRKTAMVKFDPGQADTTALIDATTDAGYPLLSTSEIAMSDVILESVLTCPQCGFAKQEVMPTDACQYFYECSNCKALLRPKPGDCCVFCSFGSVMCPPVQEQRGCCG